MQQEKKNNEDYLETDRELNEGLKRKTTEKIEEEFKEEFEQDINKLKFQDEAQNIEAFKHVQRKEEKI